MVGSALVVATGGAILDASSGQPARAVETTVVDLVLPGTAMVPDHSRESAVGGNETISPEVSADRPRVSHIHLDADDEDPAAESPPLSAARSPKLELEAVAVAGVESATKASASPPVNLETATPTDDEDQTAGVPSHRVTVRSGDSLYLIFKRLGLPQRDLALMTGSKPLAKKLARLAPRQEIEFYVDTQSRLTRLVHRLDRIRALHVSRHGESFTFEEVMEPPEVSVATAMGVIDSSLFEAGQRAGLSDNLIMQMAEIFGWDVDFALDIRAGDRFALVFEEAIQGRGKNW